MTAHALSLPPPCLRSRTALGSSLPSACCFANRPTASISVRSSMRSTSFLAVPHRKPARFVCRATDSAEEKDGSPAMRSENDETTQSAGLQSAMHRFKDTARVFFAAFLWMSLFFWASAWDGRSGGRPKSRPRFRK